MRITRKDDIREPFVDPKGERIYELIGSAAKSGGSIKHSLAYGVLPLGCSSSLHFHPEDEETYYILKGSTTMKIDGKEHAVTAGDAILIQPPERHQIIATGNRDVEYLVVCASAWKPSNSVFV
jgi:mannose-6-phosphate isomerase-like protein (cupin superfamily)